MYNIIPIYLEQTFLTYTLSQNIPAFTDLLVGVICMPFIVSKLANRDEGEWSNLKWPHNQGSCIVWLFSDLVACTASIWNLVIIAFDRFLVSL